MGVVGTNYDCCTSDISTATTCPGVIKAGASASTFEIITGKVFVYKGTSALTNPTTAPAVLSWNDDFLLASQYQWSTPNGSSKKICAKLHHDITSPKPASEAKTEADFDAKRKCTYIWLTTDSTKAPAVKLKRSDWAQFQMQWVEWDSRAMTTGAFLPLASVTPHFLGDYGDADSSGAKPWPNPLKTDGLTGWDESQVSAILEANGDPAYALAGDIGEVAYYPYLEGPFTATQITTMSFARLQRSYSQYTQVYNDFNTAKATYDVAR